MNRSIILLRTILCVGVVLYVFCTLSSASAMEKVTLQLKWVHQFQFAGYYAALQQGYYRDAGLDVSIVPATPGSDPALAVIDGKAEYGVGTSSLLIQRNAGKPVVILAVIFQHSPYILLTKEGSATQSIHSFAGKRLMLEHQANELIAYLQMEGLPLDKMQLVEHSFNAKDLIDGKVDVISGYITDDPDVLARAGFRYQLFTPRSWGIDFYGDNLFTTERELKGHPGRARAFREASLKGWLYAMQHTDEIIDLISTTYAPKSDRAHLKYEAEQVRQLIQPDLVEIGYMHAGRWRHIADTYDSLGIKSDTVDLQKFMYNPHPDKDLTLLYRIVSVLLGIGLLASAVRLIVTSHRLKTNEAQIRIQLNEINQINISLEEQVEKRAKEIENANVLLQLFMKYSPVYTFIQESTRTESRVLMSSENYRDMIGISGSQMVGKTMFELFPAELAEKITADNWAVISGGQVVNMEESYNGHVYYTIKFPIPLADKTLLAGYTIDITEQKQLQTELQLRNSQLALATNLARIVPWELDPVRFEFIFNDQFYAFYGTTSEREGGYIMPAETYLREFSHPEDVPLVQYQIERVFAPGSDVMLVELDHRIVSRDGMVNNVMTRVTIERDDSGAVTKVFGYNQDITERKQMELALRNAMTAAEAANSAKSLFLSNMSHEIRTPLNAVIGYSALMLGHNLEPGIQDYAGKIHTSGKLLLNIINDILDYSKIESGNLTLEKITFRPEVVIGNLLSMVQQNAREKGLIIRSHLPQEIAPFLVGDPHRLTQILVNLLSNAVKFTIHGEVELTATLLQEVNDRQLLQFSIRDTGVGLTTEQIGKLFRPFTQADESTTRQFGGTGLGLSISKQLVELMGGEISCTSRQGAGSTFSFTAWFGIGHATDADLFELDTPPCAESTSSFDFSGRRILLVEDIQTNQQLVIELLKDTGVSIDLSDNGSDAVAQVCNSGKTYDLVLMDIQMPVMDGYQATRLIRADGRFAGLPIIAMTAHAMVEEQRKIMQAGMDVHIAKPINIRILLQVMNLFINAPQKPPVPGITPHHQEPVIPSKSQIGENVGTPAQVPDGVEEESLPRHVSGLDFDAALLRLNGKVKMYKWLLRSFVENWASGTAMIEEALNGGDMELAARHAHSIKGSAGTIGADELGARAQALEAAVSSGESLDSVVNRHLPHFAEELNRLIAGLTGGSSEQK